MAKTKQRDPNALDIIDESFAILKLAGTQGLAYYYLGSLPFVIVFLYLIGGTNRGTIATFNQSFLIIVVGAAFLWMKCFQSIFTQYLYQLRLGNKFKLNKSIVIKTFIFQSTHQVWALIILPISLLISCVIAIPFGWTYAYYQNITVLGYNKPNQSANSQAYQLALLWPKQNHFLIWLASPWFLFCSALFSGIFSFFIYDIFKSDIGMLLGYGELPWLFLASLILVLFWPLSPICSLVAINIGILIFISPTLGHILFGIESTFTKNGIFGIVNTSTVYIVLALTYLIMDPIIKAIYVLRCFYGQSIKSGQDLISDITPYLQKSKKVLPLILFCLLLIPTTSYAKDQTNPISPTKLDKSIKETISKSKYTWKLPPHIKDELESQDTKDDNNGITWLNDLGKFIKTNMKDLFKWLEDSFFNKDKHKDIKKESSSSSIDWGELTKYIAIAFMIITGILLLITLYRSAKEYKKNQTKTIAPTVKSPLKINLKDENITAADLPEQEWLNMANEMLNKQEYRLGLRALYLGLLAFLDGKEIILLKAHKTNMDYHSEVLRRKHMWNTLPSTFKQQYATFECCWYGTHPVGIDDWHNFKNNIEELKGALNNDK